jgi:hypothetical protein
MAEIVKGRRAKRKDWPVEKPKKLPAALPKKFDSEQGATSGNKKRGKGRTHMAPCERGTRVFGVNRGAGTALDSSGYSKNGDRFYPCPC